eukprot:TRINITY_DN13594_c0_g2_i1.p1 TRINITY_DN13594_c0_g2~~TRINITY_DN13594_c0_g2_i1.p1  ORF type:complete len:190 (-),score=29.72 TRINITY_DN13594_c0_g2_i1:212-781(-)
MADNVVVSGEAAEVAERLLASSSKAQHDELAGEPDGWQAREAQIEKDFFDAPRPAQLGLGAKFVAHKHAVHSLPGMKKLHKIMKRGRQEADSAINDDATMKAVVSQQGTSAADRIQMSDDSSDDDRIEKAPARYRNSAQALSRKALLASVAQQPAPAPNASKRKKRKKGKSGTGGQGPVHQLLQLLLSS